MAGRGERPVPFIVIRFGEPYPCNSSPPLRFVESEGTVVAEAADPPPPTAGKPLVIVRRRPDGAPHVTVAEGRARVRVLDEIVPD